MKNIIDKYFNSDTVIFGHPFNSFLKCKQKYEIQNDSIIFYHRQMSKNKISKMLQALSKSQQVRESSQQDDLYQRSEDDYYLNQDQYEQEKYLKNQIEDSQSGQNENDYQDEMYVLQDQVDDDIKQKEHYPIISKSWNNIHNIPNQQQLSRFKNNLKSQKTNQNQNQLIKIKNNKSQTQQQEQDWETQQEQENYENSKQKEDQHNQQKVQFKKQIQTKQIKLEKNQVKYNNKTSDL